MGVVDAPLRVRVTVSFSRLTFKDPIASLDPESADMKMFGTMQGCVFTVQFSVVCL